MIKRIVKMEFLEENCDDFVEFSGEIKEAISNFEGCKELKILRDTKQRTIFFTCSVWESEEYLNKYRESDFFNNVWPKAKKWFSAKPLAWSTEIL
jgi:quinol monooxygenase YgiN